MPEPEEKKIVVVDLTNEAPMQWWSDVLHGEEAKPAAPLPRPGSRPT